MLNGTKCPRCLTSVNRNFLQFAADLSQFRMRMCVFVEKIVAIDRRAGINALIRPRQTLSLEFLPPNRQSGAEEI